MGANAKEKNEIALKLLLRNQQVVLCRLHSQMIIEANYKEVESLDKILHMIDQWLLILNDNERLAIILHLTCNKKWSQVAEEYERLLGQDHMRTERTLRTYQKRGIEKIITCFSEQITFAINIIPDSCLIYQKHE